MDDFAGNGGVVNSVVKFSGDPFDGVRLMTCAEVAISLDEAEIGPSSAFLDRAKICAAHDES